MNLRVELPSNWVKTTIEEIADTSSGGTPDRKKKNYFGGHIPWVKSGELNDGTITKTEETLTEEGLNDSSAKLFPKGTVCIALYGATVGKLGILGIEAATNQAVCGIFPAEGLDVRFLFYGLLCQRRILIASGKGGAQDNISQEIVRQAYFPLPPSNEQRRIVAEIEKQFARLEECTAALRRVAENLKQYRASVLKAACEGRLVPTEAELARAEGRDYEPASVLLERILAERRARWEADQLARMKAQGRAPKDDKWKEKYEVPDEPAPGQMLALPEGWIWASLEQASDETRAITYGVIKLGETIQSGVPTLRSSDVRHLQLDLHKVKRISPRIANEYQRTFLKGGEVLVTVRGTLGGVVVVPKTCAGYNISREVAMVALVEEAIGPAIAIMIGTPLMQNWLMANSRGLAYTGINIETLKNMPVPLPPLTEQYRIVAEVERRLHIVDELEELVSVNLERADELRRSILKRAFEGRLVPQDPNDESAAALLERIAAERERRAEEAMTKKKTPSDKRTKLFPEPENETWQPASTEVVFGASSSEFETPDFTITRKPHAATEQNKPLSDATLFAANHRLTVEDLFQKSGYRFDSEDDKDIDTFFERLTAELEAARLTLERADNDEVFIKRSAA